MLERVMLSYIDITTGHKRAAQAVHKTFKMVYPNIEILELDPLGYFHPVIENIIGKVYFEMLKTNPHFWEYVYDNEKIVKFTAKFRQILNSLNSSRLSKLFYSFNPQAVVCTHAFSCGIFSALKEKRANGLLLIGIITDFDVHSYWIHKNVSSYIVANEYTAEKLQQKGIDKKRIKILGIPIDPVFTEDKNIQDLKKKYNLKEDLSTILVMGGGLGFGPIEKIVYYLNEIENIEFQIIVVAGTNKELELKLIELTSKLPKLTKIFGHVDFIDELMKVSDVFITKPGGMTSAESLSCCLPMVIVNPIPGQEDRNTQYLTSQGVAIKANNEFEISKIILELLTKPQKLNEMRSKILNIRKPKSAFNIVKAIEELIVKEQHA
jgi:processive 1,2-diacylglycerol beta-glucosyltransferase